MIGILILTR